MRPNDDVALTDQLNMIRDIHKLITLAKDWHGPMIVSIMPWRGVSNTIENITLIKCNIEERIKRMEHIAPRSDIVFALRVTEQRDFLKLVLDKVITPKLGKLLDIKAIEEYFE